MAAAYAEDIPTLLAALATEREKVKKVEKIIEVMRLVETQLREAEDASYGTVGGFADALTDALANYSKATGPRPEGEG